MIIINKHSKLLNFLQITKTVNYFRSNKFYFKDRFLNTKSLVRIISKQNGYEFLINL